MLHKFILHKLPSAIAGWAAFALVSLSLAVVPSPTRAETMITDNCVGTRGLESCVTMFRRPNPNPYIIRVPTPISEREMADHRQRDKLWEERCKPTIRQDDFGVQRYVYAARGCEFGKLN